MRLVFGAFVGLWPLTALCQDPFSLLGVGAEAKVHAGAGLLSCRNAPCNYYNPANLTLSLPGIETYLELDVAAVSYGYAYPGYDPVFVEVTTPVPLLGVAYGLGSGMGLALSILPIPAGSQKINDLPTRTFATDVESKPTLVDAESKGKGLGYRASLGFGGRLFSGFALGLSLNFAQDSGKIEARDAKEGGVLVEQESSTFSYEPVLGMRLSLAQSSVIAALAVHLPARAKTKGTSRFPSLDPDAVGDDSGSRTGPMGIDIGAEVRVGPGLRPFAGYRQTSWSALRSQKERQLLVEAEPDLFDTHDIATGLDWLFHRHRLTAAVARYESAIGDGIMDFAAADDKELIGMQFQNVDGMPRTVVALGWGVPITNGNSLQTGLSYGRGSRDVWEKARGYGSYDLVIWQLIAGTTLRF